MSDVLLAGGGPSKPQLLLLQQALNAGNPEPLQLLADDENFATRHPVIFELLRARFDVPMPPGRTREIELSVHLKNASEAAKLALGGGS